MMTHRWLVPALLALACLLPLHADAPAKGTLTATGDGIVTLRCAGTVTVTVKGAVWVAATAKVTTTGKAGTTKDETRDKVAGSTYAGYDSLTVTAEQPAALTVTGTAITLTATGAGLATCVGTGKYTLVEADQEGKEAGHWSAAPKKGETPHILQLKYGNLRAAEADEDLELGD